MWRLKTAIISLSLGVTLGLFGAGVLGFQSASAATPCSVSNNCTLKDNACSGISEIDPSSDCTSKGNGIYGIVRAVVNILSILVGIVGIIMVIIAGFKYITSAGDAGRTSSAKTTLIYALVGLIIAALAQFLVHFVLNAATDATTPCPYNIKGHPNITISDSFCKKP